MSNARTRLQTKYTDVEYLSHMAVATDAATTGNLIFTLYIKSGMTTTDIYVRYPHLVTPSAKPGDTCVSLAVGHVGAISFRHAPLTDFRLCMEMFVYAVFMNRLSKVPGIDMANVEHPGSHTEEVMLSMSLCEGRITVKDQTDLIAREWSAAFEEAMVSCPNLVGASRVVSGEEYGEFVYPRLREKQTHTTAQEVHGMLAESTTNTEAEIKS